VKLRDIIQSEDGGAAIELGILFPFLLAFAVGVSDVGAEMLSAMAVNNALQTGAAYAVMNPADIVGGGSGILAVMNATSGLTIEAIPAPTLSNGIVTLTAKASFAPILHRPGSPAALTSTLKFRIE
jgi:Flp pilus assembly protein TadG